MDKDVFELSKKLGECAGDDECTDCFDRDGTRALGDFVRPGLWLCQPCAAARPLVAHDDQEYNDDNDPPPALAQEAEQRTWEAEKQAAINARRAEQAEEARAWEAQAQAAKDAHEQALTDREDAVAAHASARATRIAELAAALRDDFKLDNRDAVAIARETLLAAEAEIPQVDAPRQHYEMDVNSRRVTSVRSTMPQLDPFSQAARMSAPSGPNGGPPIDPLGASFGDSVIARSIALSRGI